MQSEWTRGLEPELEKDVRVNFKEALVIRKRLKTILESKIESRREQSSGKTGYDSPNWAYLQADAMGYERALREIILYLID